MTEHDDIDSGTEVDRDVRAMYRAAASEATPAELDRAIIREAARELKRADVQRQNWFRPVAFAATVAMSLALVLNFTETGLLDSPADAVTTAGGDATSGRVSRPTASGESLEEPQQDAAAVSEAFNEAAEIAERHAEGFEAAASQRLQPSPASAGKLGEPASAIAAEGACTREQTVDADTWWRCIEELRRNGETELAAAELERLSASYPDYAPPQ